MAENDIPETVAKTIRTAVNKYDDIDDVCEYVWNRVVKYKTFWTFMETLAYRHIRRMVADERHQRTRRIKHNNGAYGKGAKVDYNRGAAIKSIHSTVYDIAIGGKTLGTLTGAELRPIAESERAISNGHLKNAILLENISTRVKPNKTVKECLSARQLGAEVRKAEYTADRRIEVPWG